MWCSVMLWFGVVRLDFLISMWLSLEHLRQDTVSVVYCVQIEFGCLRLATWARQFPSHWANCDRVWPSFSSIADNNRFQISVEYDENGKRVLIRSKCIYLMVFPNIFGQSFLRFPFTALLLSALISLFRSLTTIFYHMIETVFIFSLSFSTWFCLFTLSITARLVSVYNILFVHPHSVLWGDIYLHTY